MKVTVEDFMHTLVSLDSFHQYSLVTSAIVIRPSLKDDPLFQRWRHANRDMIRALNGQPPTLYEFVIDDLPHAARIKVENFFRYSVYS